MNAFFDLLFLAMAASCAGFLLYGAWLCARAGLEALLAECARPKPRYDERWLGI